MNLFDRQKSVNIVLEAGVGEAIQLAAADLQRNLRDLSGIENGFLIVNESTEENVIQIQTRNCGETESYEVCVDDEKVLITGSDTLGTVYGIYTFATNCLHIMPTYRLTDVFPEKQESMEFRHRLLNQKSVMCVFVGGLSMMRICSLNTSLAVGSVT